MADQDKPQRPWPANVEAARNQSQPQNPPKRYKSTGGKFSVSDQLDAIELDLRPYVDKVAEIPEPTSQMLEKYRESVLEAGAEVAPHAKLLDDEGEFDHTRVKTLMQANAAFAQTQKRALVEVAQGAITDEDLEALPGRVFDPMYDFLRDQLLGEAPPEGTSG